MSTIELEKCKQNYWGTFSYSRKLQALRSSIQNMDISFFCFFYILHKSLFMLIHFLQSLCLIVFFLIYVNVTTPFSVNAY